MGNHPEAPVTAIYGSDPALVSAALTRAITAAGGDGLGTEQGPLTLALLADAAALPMFAESRVLIARGADKASAEVIDALVDYLEHPADTTQLILEWEAAKLPAKLTAAARAGTLTVIDANPPRTAGDRAKLIADTCSRHNLRLDGRARALLTNTVGEDVARVESILALCEATYGPGATITDAELADHLGSPGSVPPWEITDAISDGNISGALRTLGRLLDGGERHPLVVAAILRSHYQRIFTVAAADVTDEKAAAKLLGMKGSSYPARKAIGEARRLGAAGIEAAMELLAPLDDALKGGSGVPARSSVEILVARLAQLHRNPRR